MLSQTILTQTSLSEDQFIADLTNLFKRRNIGFGDPQDLERLASDLASDEAFRSGLFNLCTVISRMTEIEQTPQELLALVARASGGQGIVDAEGALAIPISAETAFLTGYEAWTTREHDLSAFAESRHTDPFHTALTLAAADGSRPAPIPLRPIPPNTPLDSLTLGELRQYLDDIERRVSHIDPHLDPLPRNSSAEASEKAPEITPPAEQTPTPAPILELALKTRTPAITRSQRPALSTLSILSADEPATQPETANATADAARLKRLRIANIILVILLIISVAFAAAVAYQYLYVLEKPAKLTPLAPIPESVSQPNAQSADASPPARTSPVTGRDAKPPQTSQAAAAAKPDAIVFPSPVTSSETKPPAPIVRQQPEPTSPPPVPAEAIATPPSEPRPAEAAPRPPAPTPAATQVADARPAPPAAAPAPAPTPVIRPPQPANTAVKVPSTKMMSYALSAPQPVPPPTRRNSPDTTVEVVAIISQDGKVTSAQALSGTPDARPAAINAMQAWRFKPYLVDGKPVEVITTFKFLFKGN